jgi:hypothetical protein
MFRKRVTSGNQVAIGSSHKANHAHQTPAAAKPASKARLTSRNGRTDRPVTMDS